MQEVLKWQAELEFDTDAKDGSNKDAQAGADDKQIDEHREAWLTLVCDHNVAQSTATPAPAAPSTP